MGGIVAAETLLLLASEQPLPPMSSVANPDVPNYPSNTTLGSSTGTSHPNPDVDQVNTSTTFMFPHIQGLLAFDTPFLGLAPGMVAHGIEGGHKMATNAYNTINEVSSLFGWGSRAEHAASSTSNVPKTAGALPAPPSAGDAAAAPKWQSWGKYAMFAGAAGAIAAGGAAALYSQREKISAGWSWASSHLLFVGCLARPEELRKRVQRVDAVCRERGLGSANLYTNLGCGAREGYGLTASVTGTERTFCNLPKAVAEGKDQKGGGLRWHKSVNDKAKDETTAHVSMFFPRDNPGFYSLGENAKQLVVGWVDKTWYDDSEEDAHGNGGGAALGEVGEGWEKPDYDDDEVKSKEREKAGQMDVDWEGLDEDGAPKGDGGFDEDDVNMRDEFVDKDDADKDHLGGSVIVEKAGRGEIPLPPPSPPSPTARHTSTSQEL